MITLDNLKALRGRHIMFTVLPPEGVFGKVANLTFVQAMGFEHNADLAGYPAHRLLAPAELSEEEADKIAKLTDLHDRVRRLHTVERWENWLLALQGTARIYVSAETRWTGEAFEESGEIVNVELALFEMEPMLPVISAAQEQSPAPRVPKVKPQLPGVQMPMDLHVGDRLLWPAELFMATLADLVFPHLSDAPKIETVRRMLGEELNLDKKPFATNTLYTALRELAVAQDETDEAGYYAVTLRRVYEEWMDAEYS